MKSFIISSILFSFLIIAILINAIYINEGIDHLTEITEALGDFNSEGFNDKLEELEECWKHFRKAADISCSYSELNRIDTTFRQLRSYANTKSQSEYEATRSTLIILLNDLSRLEKITLKGLI